MPLPKPPAKRAALLTPSDFEAQAAPKPAKRGQKTSAVSEPASPAELTLQATPEVMPTLPRAIAPVIATPAPAAVKRPAVQPRPRKPRSTGPAKLFVLDTNVLMHDPMSLFRF